MEEDDLYILTFIYFAYGPRPPNEVESDPDCFPFCNDGTIINIQYIIVKTSLMYCHPPFYSTYWNNSTYSKNLTNSKRVHEFFFFFLIHEILKFIFNTYFSRVYIMRVPVWGCLRVPRKTTFLGIVRHGLDHNYLNTGAHDMGSDMESFWIILHYGKLWLYERIVRFKCFQMDKMALI